MTSDSNRQRVLDYLEAVRLGDHARVRAAFAPEATWDTTPSMPWPAHFEGRDSIIDDYFAVDTGLFTTGVSSYDLEILHVIDSGPHVVVEMRHRAEMLSGKRYETDHCLVFELHDGLITAVREYIDSLYLDRQQAAAQPD